MRPLPPPPLQRMDTSGRTVLDPTAGGGAQTAKQMFGKVGGVAFGENIGQDHVLLLTRAAVSGPNATWGAPGATKLESACPLGL